MSQYQKGKTICILLKQETVSGSGNSWAVCKSAPHSRQIAIPAPHHSVFYRPDSLPDAQPTASKHKMAHSIDIQKPHPRCPTANDLDNTDRKQGKSGQQAQVLPPNCPFHGGPGPPPECTVPWARRVHMHIASRSAGPFLQDSCLSSTDTQTDRPCYLCNKNTHTCLTALCPGLHG